MNRNRFWGGREKSSYQNSSCIEKQSAREFGVNQVSTFSEWTVRTTIQSSIESRHSQMFTIHLHCTSYSCLGNGDWLVSTFYLIKDDEYWSNQSPRAFDGIGRISNNRRSLYCISPPAHTHSDYTHTCTIVYAYTKGLKTHNLYACVSKFGAHWPSATGWLIWLGQISWHVHDLLVFERWWLQTGINDEIIISPLRMSSKREWKLWKTYQHTLCDIVHARLLARI